MHRRKHFESRFSVDIWCGAIGSQVIGPFILEERLASDGYLRFLKVELSVLLEDVPLQIRRQLWLQQDGALRHFGRHVTAFLNQYFTNRSTGRQGPVAWPSRSPDLTLLDYYF
jgi:hypothetical protein